MARVPDPNLTPVQFEILQAAWEREEGATVSEIWEAIGQRREVGRTTIINLVDRLEKRGWLARQKADGVFRYQPTVDRQSAVAHVTSEFVEAFFSGSARDLVMSLLGSKRIPQDELDQLRALLDERRSNAKRPKGSRK